MRDKQPEDDSSASGVAGLIELSKLMKLNEDKLEYHFNFLYIV